MPFTKKGKKIFRKMKKTYGAVLGKQVFYASENAGRIKGVHDMRFKVNRKRKLRLKKLKAKRKK